MLERVSRFLRKFQGCVRRLLERLRSIRSASGGFRGSLVLAGVTEEVLSELGVSRRVSG